MDWNRAIEEERAALANLVALLISLADLAESASRRCRLVRGFVLWLLRPAEALARDFVIGAQDAPPALRPVCPAGDGPAEAVRLAEGFRDLACELHRQARLAFADREGGGRAGPPRSAACQQSDADEFMDALRSVVAATASRVAGATRRLDTS